MQKITLRILDMHCVNCAMRLESIEDDLEGVSSASASYARGTMEVRYDEALLDEERIRQAVAALGYQVGE